MPINKQINYKLMNESITLNEVMNTGTGIHLYFNGIVGLYVAYGISAFLLSRQTEVSPSYSEEMQMPVVVINVAHFNLLKEQLEVVRASQSYCCLKPTVAYNEDEYSSWAADLREKE